MKLLRIHQCFALVAIFLSANGHSKNMIVRTNTGQVKGYKVTGDGAEVYSFLGIPYAVPPTGHLRFKEPKPVESWEGVYDAKRLSALCIQQMDPPFFEWQAVGNYTFSEDCLFLNIWVPSGGNSKKEVMVWIHGGGFNTGSASLDVYDGRKIAAESNVIVVSFNYRLGVFGFLYAGTDDAPGNMGLKDQVLALRWIRSNIKKFGGDISKITVFGQSAGAMSISTHLLSPMTKGLFTRAIMQSGSAYHPLIYTNRTLGLYASNQFANFFHCYLGGETLVSNSSKVLRFLRSLTAEEISRTEKKMIGPLTSSFLPIYGDNYLPNHPLEELKAGNVHNVSVLVGNVLDEGSFFLGFLDPPLFEVDNPVITKTQAKEHLAKVFSVLGRDATEDIIDYYLSNVECNNYVKKTYEAIGDFLFYCPVVFLSGALASHELKVYNYIFIHRRQGAPYKKWLGVPHFEDVPFVFGTHLDPTETEFSKKIIRIWASFAKSGKPNAGTREEWLSYDKDSAVGMMLKPEYIVGVNPYKSACRFWKKYF